MSEQRGGGRDASLPGCDEVGSHHYEVWRVQGAVRSLERSFPELWLALRFVAVQRGGQFDIRMPDGEWFSEGRTEHRRPAFRVGRPRE